MLAGCLPGCGDRRSGCGCCSLALAPALCWPGARVQAWPRVSCGSWPGPGTRLNNAARTVISHAQYQAYAAQFMRLAAAVITVAAFVLMANAIHPHACVASSRSDPGSRAPDLGTQERLRVAPAQDAQLSPHPLATPAEFGRSMQP